MYLTSLTHSVNRKRKSLLLIATGCLILTVLSCIAGAATVIIRPNAQNKIKSDIFLKDLRTGKEVKFLTLSDVYRNRYHAAEYHNGRLYIIKSPGGEESYKTNPNWTDELWRFTRNGKGTKLWSSRGFSFRVREDENMVAIVFRPKSDERFKNLHLLASDGKVLKSFYREQLSSNNLDLLRWAGKDLWLKDQEAVDISGFIEIHTPSMVIKKFNVTLEDTDWSLNTTSKLLAYSNYPAMFDTTSDEDFKRNRTPVKLYVYNLKTKHRKFIAQTIAEDFNPKWLGSNTLEYDNPTGKGRIRKNIQF